MNTSQRIIKIKKDNDGDITDIMLEDGKIFPLNHAIMMAKHGAIEGVNVGKGKDGGEFLRSEANDSIWDNLNNLPTF
jgi:hypothetical protein